MITSTLNSPLSNSFKHLPVILVLLGPEQRV